MGLGPAPRRGLHAAINITPLVDIVLVMLVVFIIAVPAVNREIPVEVPPPSDGAPPPPQQPLTLEVRPDLSVVIDDNRGGRTEVRRVDLAAALRPQLQRPGTASTVFVDIAEPVAWRDAIAVMDTVRGVGRGTDRDLTIALPLERRVP
jgi:biopolymer transport protein ExbD